MDTDHVPSHEQTANNVPADYEAWREARWDEIASPHGKARVTCRIPTSSPGGPGQWRITEAGT